MKQLVEKYREKRKDLHVGFIDLENAYDTVCREALWRVLHECLVDGFLMRTMSSLYNRNRACERLGSRVGEYFEVNRGLRQGYLMSLSSLTN